MIHDDELDRLGKPRASGDDPQRAVDLAAEMG